MDTNKSLQLAHMRLIKSPEALYISVPSKLTDAIEHIPKELLKSVNKNSATAKELCLYFASFLTPTYFSEDITEIRLHSDNLNAIFRSRYRHIVKALRSSAPNRGPIIECDDIWEVGVKSKCYWYADAYKAKRHGNYLVSCKLKSEYVRSICIDHKYRKMLRGQQNIIINNLLNVYPLVGLPDVADLKAFGKWLEEERKTSKKGKKYKFHHRNKSRFSEEELKQFSFIEDGIQRFRLLTQDGFMMPTSQGDKAGNRITDAFALLNSWIRSRVTINERPVVECDFTCFHPNLAISVYDGGMKYISHKRVAEYCDIDIMNETEVKKFKTLHLTFFNYHENDMKNSQKMRKFMIFMKPMNRKC